MKQAYKLSETSIFEVNSNTAVLSLNGIANLLMAKLYKWAYKILNYFVLLVHKPYRVAIVGTNAMGGHLYHSLRQPRFAGYKFVGFFDTELRNRDYLRRYRGDMATLESLCKSEEIDEIFFALPAKRDMMQEVARMAEKNFVHFRSANEVLPKEIVQVYFSEEIPVMGLYRSPLASRTNQALKRAFDIVFSLCALAFLIPFVFPFIALAIKLESRGPIFFVQKRPGRHNKLFGCIKFRSMTVNNSGEQQATKNDARITKVGAFLRKTSLDELPQFINVLMGSMSVVGPRPNMVKQLEHYSQHIDNYSSRHFVTPGITGYAQVSGYRGETETLDLMEKRVEYDLAYIRNWSLLWDMKLIFLTVYNMIKGEDRAY